MPLERASRQVFLGASGLLFVASAAVTIIWCASMSAMGEMPMPGGWTMSAVWVRMPGQTWPGVAASFLGMWIVMMVAMMLPSIVPTLWRYRQAVGRAGMTHPDWLTALVGMGYFFVWTLFGAAVFPLGVGLSAIAMRQPALARAVPSDAGTAWRHGVLLGLHCGHGCAGLMAILLVVGVMDLRVMAVVTAAITAERLAAARMRVAQAIGAVIVGAGLLLTARAVGLG